MKLKRLKHIRERLKGKLHHFVFIVSLLSMSLLIIWWSYFLYMSIGQNYVNRKNTLRLELSNLFLKMNNEGSVPETPGIVGEDNRFEFVEDIKGEGAVFLEVPGGRPARFLSVRESVLTDIERDLRRKKLMLFGESGVLALVVFAGIIFLFKFINLEKRSTREMEEFWGRISHEIKTPITGIKSFLESLKSGSIDPDDLPGYITLALREIGKQEQLAENVLTGSSFRNELNLNPETFSLREFLDRYVKGHFVSLSNARLIKEFENSEDVIVKADRYALKVILDNILDNAGKYCSPGFQLKIGMTGSGRSAYILLSDDGPGFDPVCSDRIFEAYKFMKSELPETSHGTGMGLYISKKLARKMGGDLDATSGGKGSGAVFRITLPAEK